MKRTWRVVAGAMMALFGAGAGFFRPHTRAVPVPGIPPYDYQWGKRSPSAEGQSKVGILAEVPSSNKGKMNVRFYQLPVATLQIDHCFLSRVAFTLQDNGEWKLSARADQNPVKTGDVTDVGALRPSSPRGLFTEHLKRNQFFVRVRCLGNAPETKVPNTLQGPAVLFELAPPPFWVQSGEPYDLFVQGFTPDMRDFLNSIDRVEIEFYYR